MCINNTRHLEGRRYGQIPGTQWPTPSLTKCANIVISKFTERPCLKKLKATKEDPDIDLCKYTCSYTEGCGARVEGRENHQDKPQEVLVIFFMFCLYTGHKKYRFPYIPQVNMNTQSCEPLATALRVLWYDNKLSQEVQ